MGFLIFTTILLIATLSTSVLTKINFGKCAVFTCMAFTLIVYYLTCIFQHLSVSVLITSIFTIICSAIILIKHKTNLLETIKLYCRNGIIIYLIFVIICCIFAILHGESWYTIDEYQAWALQVKELFRLDYFCLGENTILRNLNDYPPIFPTLEVISNILNFKHDVFNTCATFWFFELLILFYVIPENIFKWTSKRNTLITLTIFVFISFFTLLCSFASGNVIPSFWNQISIDCVLGLLAGLSIFNIITNKINIKYIVANTILLTFLVLTKQSALFFAIINVFVVFIYLMKEKYLLKKTKIIYNCITVLIPLITWLSWQILFNFSYISSQNVVQFSINFNDIYNTIFYHDEYFINRLSFVGKDYLWSLIFVNMIKDAPIAISFIAIYIIIIFLYLCFIWTSKNNYKSKAKILLLVILITSLLYVLFMYYSYTFLLQKEVTEAHKPLPSFTRYMWTCLTYMLIPIVFLSIEKWINEAKFKYIMLFTIVLIVICAIIPSTWKDALYIESLSESKTCDDALREKASEINQNYPQYSKILVVYKNDEGALYNYYDAKKMLYFCDAMFVDINNSEEYNNQNTNYVYTLTLE